MSTTQPSGPNPYTPAGPDVAAAQYAAPEQHPYPTQQPARTTVKDTNTYALVSIIVTFMMPIAGIIFGHLGLSQIKRTGDAGRGLALTGLIYGYCAIALGVLFFVTYIGFIVMVIGAAASESYIY